MATVSPDTTPGDFERQRAVIGPLVRVIQEAAGDDPWALIGAASCRLQGVGASSPNLEFMTTRPVLRSLEGMLDVDATWRRGMHLAAERLHFMRADVPVFVFAAPVFHGSYDALSPVDIPSLWDARVAVQLGNICVLTTPLEWELLLAVVLGARMRTLALREHLRANSYDGRLLTRLLREGHVQPETEEAVWAVLERDDAAYEK